MKRVESTVPTIKWDDSISVEKSSRFRKKHVRESHDTSESSPKSAQRTSYKLNDTTSKNANYLDRIHQKSGQKQDGAGMISSSMPRNLDAKSTAATLGQLHSMQTANARRNVDSSNRSLDTF